MISKKSILLKNTLLTLLYLLIAQFILILFHCEFRFQDISYYTLNYWPNYLFNIILLYFIYLTFIVIVNRKIVATFLFLNSILLFSIANFFKIHYRGEPLLPSDFTMFLELHHIIQMMNSVHMILTIVVIILLFSILFVLLKIKSTPVFSMKSKIRISILLVLFFYSAINSNHEKNPYHIAASLFGITDSLWDLKEDYSSSGPLAGFIKNLDIRVMDEMPENYSFEAVQEIVEKYKDKSIEMNEDKRPIEDRTVIFILSESFMDPARIPGLALSEDPIPYIRSLKEETTSGILLGSSYGGGTANVEYEVMTGFSTNYFHRSLPIPYTLLVPKLNVVPNFSDLFHHKIAVHTYNASLYRRKEVFEKFGFDSFIYDGGNEDLTYTEKLDNSPYISDAAAYQEVLDLVHSDLEGSTFILLTTMQNHGPYAKDQYDNQFDVYNELASSEKARIETYVQGLAYTDAATQDFIEGLEHIDKPIVVLFFGDHLPADVFEGFDNRSDEDDLPYYETDYFLYSNFETEMLNYPMVSPNMLSAIVLRALDAELTPYYVLLDELSSAVPVIRWGEYYVASDDRHVYEDELPEAVFEAVQDYRMIMYDITAGEQYSVELGMFGE